MKRTDSQHYAFSHEAMPILFHKETAGVFKFLERDGVKFLHFWWDNVGNRLDPDRHRSPAGLAYQVKEWEKGIKVAFIDLPEPREEGEVFFMALVRLPDSSNPFVRKFQFRNTQVYTLQYEGGGPDGKPATGIYELTPRARNLRLKDGCEPEKTVFLKEIRKILKLQA
jgi:hypothetical protein